MTFLETHRISENDFTRKSALSLPNLIELFLNTFHRSINAELDNSFLKSNPTPQGTGNKTPNDSRYRCFLGLTIYQSQPKINKLPVMMRIYM